MPKLIINKLGPVETCELECSKFMNFTGFQASGKSTIAKAIYYLNKIIYVFLTIFLYLLKCPQSLILWALRAFCICGKPHISRSIFLYFLYQTWLKSW